VAAGATLQLTATARDADGRVVSAPVTWFSSADAVATVSGSGLVTGVAAGSATLRASVDGVTGTIDITVTPPPVAAVTVSPEAFSLQRTETRQLTATARDAAGAVLTGRAVAWSSLDPATATVTAGGEVRAVALGQARIVAAVEGRADTALVTVHVPTAARVEVSPGFATAAPGAETALQAQAFTADGTRVLFPAIEWTSLHAALAVTADGRASSAGPGVYRAAAQVNGARDTATVAVLGAASLLSTAFAGGAILADVRAGATVDVPVTLDLSRMGSTGDLGSLQLELRFDPALLALESHTAGAQGALEVFSPSAGVVRAAFAATAPQGTAGVTIVRLRFRVAASAAAGTRSAFTLLYTAAPTSTGFVPYAAPLVVGGRVRVVP
jgi:hypothetical protein